MWVRFLLGALAMAGGGRKIPDLVIEVRLLMGALSMVIKMSFMNNTHRVIHSFQQNQDILRGKLKDTIFRLP